MHWAVFVLSPALIGFFFTVYELAHMTFDNQGTSCFCLCIKANKHAA